MVLSAAGRVARAPLSEVDQQMTEAAATMGREFAYSSHLNTLDVKARQMKLRRALLPATFLILMTVGPWGLAQAADRVYRLGVLTPSAGVAEKMRATLFPELAKLGFAEEKNLAIEISSGQTGELPSLARRLASDRSEVVIAVGGAAIRAMREVAPTTPIVGSFIGEDPIAAGFAASLAHPGGSVTGIVMLAPELDAARLLLLHELVPGGRKIAALAVNSTRDAPNLSAISEAAERVGIKILPVYAAGQSDYPAAFAEMTKSKADALVIVSAPELFNDAALLAVLAQKAGLPTICEWASMAAQGCLIGYGPDFNELHRRVADYVARLLRGAAPGDLPIEGPTHFDAVVNLKAAKALGLTVPTAILLRANGVIE
jgi:putative ABC transport system substrate-binding protein